MIIRKLFPLDSYDPYLIEFTFLYWDRLQIATLMRRLLDCQAYGLNPAMYLVVLQAAKIWYKTSGMLLMDIDSYGSLLSKLYC